VYQISGQLENAFAFYDNFCCLTKRTKIDKKKKKTKQTKKKQRNSANFFEGTYLENTLLKFGM